jgi:hypothetical protein
MIAQVCIAALATAFALTFAAPGIAQVTVGKPRGGAMLPPPVERSISLPFEGPGVAPRGGGNNVGNPDCYVGITDPVRCGKLIKIVDPDARPAPEYGYVVAIYFDRLDGRQICTGILIAPRLVLTAGHCGCGILGSYTVDFRQNTRTGNERYVANVEGAPILYDSRVCTDGLLDEGRDLALLRLYADVNLHQPGYGYPPDMIWQLRRKLPAGRRLIAVGYGYTLNSQLGVRMQGSIPVLSADCADRRYSSYCAPFAEMILADAPGPRARADTCGGDSGGPIFLIDDDKLPKLIGVTSRAAPGAQDNPVLHCGGGGIYTLIGRTSVHAWLATNGVPQAETSDTIKIRN